MLVMIVAVYFLTSNYLLSADWLTEHAEVEPFGYCVFYSFCSTNVLVPTTGTNSIANHIKLLR